MSDQEINIAIAEECPDKFRCEHGLCLFQYSTDCWSQCHNNSICQDLNAMHEAEEKLTNEQLDFYCNILHKPNHGIYWAIHATARQRAEAFLRTIGKWEESAK